MRRLEFSPDEDAIRVDVEGARLDFPTKLGTECDVPALRAVIEDAGYQLGEVTVDGVVVP